MTDNKTSSHWNYRVVAEVEKIEALVIISYTIKSVYYSDGIPHSTSATPAYISSETVEDLVLEVQRFKEALEKPILWGEEGKNLLKDYKHLTFNELRGDEPAEEAYKLVQENILLGKFISEAIKVKRSTHEQEKEKDKPTSGESSTET